MNDADGYDVFLGSLSDIVGSGGDFSELLACLAEDQEATTYERLLAASTEPEYYFVRAVNCGGNGTLDTGGTGQAGSRDAEAESSATCE